MRWCASFPVLRLDAEAARGLLQGRTLALAGASGRNVLDGEGFLGLAQWQDDGRLAARQADRHGDRATMHPHDFD